MATTLDGRVVVWPTSEPIHLNGEADAYVGERVDSAFDRLFYVACECGYSANRMRNSDGLPSICVATNDATFMLNYDRDGLLYEVRRQISGGNWITHWPTSAAK